MSDSSPPSPPTTSPTPPAPEKNNDARNRQLLIVTGVIVGLGVAWVIYWLLVLQWRETTDNAYVNGDFVQVTSRVAGTVTQLNGRNMDSVTAGQPLIVLDNSDAQVQLQEAASALASAVRQYRQQSAQAAQVDEQIAAQRLELQRAQADLARREPLLKDQAIAAEEVAHARDAVAVASATLAQSQRQADALHALLDGTTVRTHPSILQAKATYLNAWLNVQRNIVQAPVAGYMTQNNVQLGQRIAAGQTLTTIVPLAGVWIDANFKEGQLRNMRIGQPVEVVSDLYGGKVTYRGKVVGIGIGTGAAFALLPTQNASGNWIKVIQRVPVRIQLDAEEVRQHPLRVGLSTEVTVSTRDRTGQVLRPAEQNPPRTTAVYDLDTKQADAQMERIIAAQLK